MTQLDFTAYMAKYGHRAKRKLPDILASIPRQVQVSRFTEVSEKSFRKWVNRNYV